MIVECPNCHFEQPLEGDFCPKCGKLIRPLLVSEKKKEIKQKRKTRMMLFSMGSLLIVGCSLFFYFLTLNSQDQNGAQMSLSTAEKIKLRKQQVSLNRERAEIIDKPSASNSFSKPPSAKSNAMAKKVSATALKPFSVNSSKQRQEDTPSKDNESPAEQPNAASDNTASNSLEVSHIFLMDLYSCDLQNEASSSVPRKLNSETLPDFLDCGQILLEDRLLNNESFLIEDGPDFSLKAKISAQDQQVRMLLNLERLGTDSITNLSNQNSYSFQNIKKRNAFKALTFRYSPPNVEEDFYINALSNSAIASVLYAPTPESKETPTYIYIFVVFK